MFPFPKCYYLKSTGEKFRGNIPESIHFYPTWLWKVVSSASFLSLKGFKQIFIGSLLCSKSHGINTWFCYKMDNESVSLVPSCCGWHLQGAHWGTLGKRRSPLTPSTPSLRREQSAEDLGSSSSPKPDISPHGRVHVNTLHSSDVKSCRNASWAHYNRFLTKCLSFEHSCVFSLE